MCVGGRLTYTILTFDPYSTSLDRLQQNNN